MRSAGASDATRSVGSRDSSIGPGAPRSGDTWCEYGDDGPESGSEAKRVGGSGPCPLVKPRACTSDRLRVAVCLAGTVRTLTREHVFESIAERLVGGLQAGRTDVFAVLRLEDTSPKRQRGWNFASVPASHDALTRALGPLRPRAVVIEEEERVGLINPRCQLWGFMGHGADLTMRSVAQPASWERCLRAIRRAEAADGRRYDLVVRARPDAWWYRNSPPACSLMDRLSAHQYAFGERGGVAPDQWGHIDQHFVVARRGADAIFSGMMDEYRRCNGTTFPHSFLESWLLTTFQEVSKQENLTLARVNFPHVLVRSDARQPSAEGHCNRAGISFGFCMCGAYPESCEHSPPPAPSRSPPAPSRL